MLEHLGLAESAHRITSAVEADLAARRDTRRSTAEIGDALASLAAG
jgi:3-isopropylmalate dehydrogenase